MSTSYILFNLFFSSFIFFVFSFFVSGSEAELLVDECTECSETQYKILPILMHFGDGYM